MSSKTVCGISVLINPSIRDVLLSSKNKHLRFVAVGPSTVWWDGKEATTSDVCNCLNKECSTAGIIYHDIHDKLWFCDPKSYRNDKFVSKLMSDKRVKREHMFRLSRIANNILSYSKSCIINRVQKVGISGALYEVAQAVRDEAHHGGVELDEQDDWLDIASDIDQFAKKIHF